MINWILSFIICSGLLLGVYHLILKNESFYRFNRFFLLFALLFSAMVPFMTIHLPERIGNLRSQLFKHEQSTSAVTTTPQIVQPVLSTQAVVIDYPQQVTEPKPEFNWSQFWWILYVLPALILLIRLLRNSYVIGKIIKSRRITLNQDVKLILIDDNITPHSFLKYIFVNRDEYDAGRIEPQIICHERAHIRQLHSLDVIFAELMQVLFWFNPFVPLYKRAIQLNHEFLADEAVTSTYADVVFYQHLLLAKASLPGSLSLTSQFNYLTIKNRIVMMTKTTSAKTNIVKKAAVALIVSIAVFLFAGKVIANNNVDQQKISANSDIVDMIGRGLTPILSASDVKHIAPAKKAASLKTYTDYMAIMFKYNLPYITQQAELTGAVFRMPKEDRVKAQQLFNQMNAPQQAETIVQFKELLMPAHSRQPTAAEFSHWENLATKLRVWIDGKEIGQADLKRYQPSTFVHYNYGMLSLANPDYGKYEGELHLMTPGFFKKDNELISNDNFQIAILNARLVAMHLTTSKPFLADDYKYYERILEKRADGKKLECVRVYNGNASYGQVEVTPGAKVAFFIDGVFYSEADFKNLSPAMIAKIQLKGHVLGARDITQKQYPGVDLHGYEGLIWVSTNGLPDRNRVWEKEIPELKQALAKF